MANEKKFLDSSGIGHLWDRIEERYPNMDELGLIIDAIDEAKADRTDLENVANEVDTLKKSVSDGKALVAGAITEKGVETATDASFEVMASNIGSIQTGIGIDGIVKQYEVASNQIISEGAFVSLAEGTTDTVGRYNGIPLGIAGMSGTAGQIIDVYCPKNTQIPIPTLSESSFYYTGETITPVINNYNSGQVIIEGQTSGTTVGSYSITITPKGGYEWSDGTTTAITLTWSIKNQQIAVPTQSGKAYATGLAVSPTWSGYDSTKMTIGGTQSATEVGTYIATFTPKANCEWTDGTTTAKDVTWLLRVNAPEILTDFAYNENDDGTATITAWNGTSNGVPGTELIVPDNKYIIF